MECPFPKSPSPCYLKQPRRAQGGAGGLYPPAPVLAGGRGGCRGRVFAGTAPRVLGLGAFLLGSGVGDGGFVEEAEQVGGGTYAE